MKCISASMVQGFVAAIIALGSSGAQAISPEESDPEKIVEAASKGRRLAHAKSQISMTIRSDDGTQRRELTVWTLSDGNMQKSRTIIESPADLRGTAFLGFDYLDKGKRDEQWIYLPKLRKVSRIPSSGRGESFAGSDFSYSDMASPVPDDYRFRMVAQEESVDGDTCWVIEGLPANDRVAENTGYERVVFWLSKEKLIVLRAKLQKRAEPQVKYLRVDDVRHLDSGWAPFVVQMRTLEGKRVVSETRLQVERLDTSGDSINPGDLTVQRLESGR